MPTNPANIVRREADKVREATERRNAAIVAMSNDGASLRAIGEAAGLTHTGVAKIIARHAAAN